MGNINHCQTTCISRQEIIGSFYLFYIYYIVLYILIFIILSVILNIKYHVYINILPYISTTCMCLLIFYFQYDC